MRGEVTSLDLSDLTVHVYTAPAENYMINSVIFELADELLVVDAQMFLSDASEFADLIEGIGKPVRQFILSHNHPDHFSGFEVICSRFPDVPLAALPGVTDYVATLGPEVIAARRAEMGPLVASTAVVPTTELTVGEQIIGGVRFVFEGFDDAEAESQVVIHLPDHQTAAVFDLACRAEHHCFTVRPSFDQWIEIMRQLQGATTDVRHLIVGHGVPTDVGALDATIEYLRVAIHRQRSEMEVATDVHGDSGSPAPDHGHGIVAASELVRREPARPDALRVDDRQRLSRAAP